MAQLSKLPFSASFGSSGLSEFDIIVPTTDTYVVICTLTLPIQSVVVTTILVNSSTKYTSNAGDKGLKCEVACTAGDTIKIITASAAANDNAINAVRIQASIDQGIV